TGGFGRRWEATEPQAFWRDLAELDFNNQQAVLALIRRRGDPGGVLSPRAETHTGRWSDLAALLGVAALAWEPADTSGVSNVTTDLHRLWQADHFAHGKELALRLLKDDLEVVSRPAGGLMLRACSLGAFMVVSAASALERRVPMRRCALCASWFELARQDA